MTFKQQFDELAKYLNAPFQTLKSDQRIQASKAFQKIELDTLMDHQKTVIFLQQVSKTLNLDLDKISIISSVFCEKLRDVVKPMDSEQDKTELTSLEYAGFQTPEQDLASLQTFKRFSTKETVLPIKSYYTKLNEKILALLIYLAQKEVLKSPKQEEKVPYHEEFKPTNINIKILMDSNDRACCPNNHILVRQSGVSKRFVPQVYEASKAEGRCPECHEFEQWRSFYKHENTLICPPCFFKKVTPPVKPCCNQCGAKINVDDFDIYFLCEEFEDCPNDFCLTCVTQFNQRHKLASIMLRVTQEMQHISHLINQTTQDHDFLFTNYLDNATECYWMFNQTKPPHPCLELLKLDNICQKWADQTQSPSVCVRLASLTGNLSYFLKAILLLTQPNPLPLLGHEVIAPILSSNCLVPKSPFHSAPLKIEVKIEPSQLKAKLKILKSTLYQEKTDTTLRYLKNERSGKTLTDPILTRIQWFDPNNHVFLDYQVQSEGIKKIQQEQLLDRKVNLVSKRFKKIEHFETVFILTMMTLVKKGSLGNQRPLLDTRDLKIIDMKSSPLVQQWVKQKYILTSLPLPETLSVTLPLCSYLEAEDTAKTCSEQMRAGKFNYNESLSNATLALLEPYFNFEIDGHKFIKNEAFKEYDFVFHNLLHWLGVLVAFSKAKIALGSQVEPCILALDQNTYEFQLLSDDLNVIEWRDVQTKEKLASLFQMCKARKKDIKMIESWLSDDGKPYLSIVVQEDFQFYIQSFNLLQHSYNKKADFPIVLRQTMFQAMDIKNSYLTLLSNKESCDTLELVHLPTAVSVLTQKIISEPSVYLKLKPSEFIMYKQEQTSDPSEYVPHSVLKHCSINSQLNYPLDLKHKMQEQEIKFFLQKFQREEASQLPLIEASGVQWALYLARIVEHHSAGESQSQLLSHLNICCSENYFKLIDQLIETIQADEPQLKAAKTLIMLSLSQNIINNLKALKNKSLSQMIGWKEAIRLMAFHYTLDPTSIEHYVSAFKDSSETLLTALTESDTPELFRKAVSQYIVYAKSDKSNITLQRLQCEQLNQKVAHALLIKVVVGPPDNCKDLSDIFKYVLESQQLSLLHAFVICLHTSQTIPKEILGLLSELLATRSYLPKETEKDILWLVGTKQVAMLLKPMRKEEFQNYDHKGYLVTQSEIFSGGMDHSYLALAFSQTTQDMINSCHAPIFQTLFRNLKSGMSETLEETLSLQIIYPGRNQIVDDIIQGFEIHLRNRKPFLAQTGQQMGLQLSRAAFAVLIKLNYGQISDFQEMTELVEIECPLEEPGPERNLQVLRISQTFTGFQALFQLWENSSKIRMWLQAKKTSIQDKIGRKTDVNEVRETQQSEHLSKILTNILDKAQFLVKLETASFKSKQEVNISSLQRQPSYVQAEQTEEQPKFESNQVANQEAKMREARKAAAESVIACLESPVLVADIKNQVEILFTQAITRLAALSFIDRLLVESTPIDEVNDLIGWLSNLQSSSGKLTHYMDGIRGGCSIQIEDKLREVFFSILKKLAIRLASTACVEQANTIPRSLQWQFQARDFTKLFDEINIFKLLSKGDESVTSIVAQSWAKLSSNEQFSKDLSSTIKDLFFAVLARVTDNSAAQLTKLKVQGSQTLAMLVPSLQRVKSIVDQDVSSVLLDSAVRVVFRSFHDITAKYNKLVCLSDEEVKKTVVTVGQSVKCNQGHLLQPYLKPQSRSNQRGGGYFNCDLCPKKLHPNSSETYYSCQDCLYHCCQKCFGGHQNFWTQFNFGAIEDLLKADIAVVQTLAVVEEENLFMFFDEPSNEPPNKIEQKRLDSETAEVIFLKYGEVFLDDLIQMMLVFSSVGGVSTSAREVLIKIARPEYIKTLFELLLTPIKIEHLFKVLVILENLQKLQVSLELPVDFQSKIQLPQIKIFEEVIADTLFNYAVFKYENKKRDQAKILLRTARKFVNDGKLRMVLDKISDLQDQTQILLMMMLDSGLELRTISFGSSVTLINPPLLLVEDRLTVVSTVTKNKIVYYNLFSQLQNRCVKHQASKLKPINRLDSVLPQITVLVQLLLKTTSRQITCAILNFLSNNRCLIDDYNTLQNYLEKLVIQDSFLTQIQNFESEFFVWYQPDELEQQILDLQESPDSLAPSLALKFLSCFDLHQINLFTAFQRLDQQDPEAFNIDFKNALKTNAPERLRGELDELLTQDNLQVWTQKVTDLLPETIIEITNTSTLKNLSFKVGKINTALKLETLPNQLISQLYFIWVKALTVLFEFQQISEPTSLWHLHKLYSQIKKRNLVLRQKKTGVTGKWLTILMKATPEFRYLYVQRILERRGPDTNLLIKLTLRLIEADAEICTQFSFQVIRWLLKHGISQNQDFTDWICRVLQRITLVQDKTSALKICECGYFRELIDIENDKAHFKIQKLRKLFAEMCSANGVEWESLNQVIQSFKKLEFLKTKGILIEQVEAAIPGQFKTLKCNTQLIFNQDPVFGVNVLEVRASDGQSKYHIMQKDKQSFPADYTEVRVVEQNFLCLLTDSDTGEFLQLPENIVIKNPKLYSSSKDDGFYLTNEIGERKELYYKSTKIPFEGQINNIVTTYTSKGKPHKDILIDGLNQPYFITDDFQLESILSFQGQIQQIAVLNFDSKFLVITEGKIRLIQNGTETDLEFQELQGAGEFKIISQRALLKQTWESVLLEYKSAQGKYVFEVNFVENLPPTFSLVCPHVYESFGIGVTSAWGIKPDKQAEIITNQKGKHLQEELLLQDRYPAIDHSYNNFERAFYQARKNNTQFEDELDDKFLSHNQLSFAPISLVRGVYLFKNNCELKFKLKDGSIYSTEQVADSVQRLNLQTNQNDFQTSFKNLKQQNKVKIDSFACQTSDFLDRKILQLNKKFRSNFKILKEMVRDKNYDQIELRAFRSQFVLPQIDNKLYQQIVKEASTWNKEVKIQINRIDQTESLFEQLFRQTNHIYKIYLRPYGEQPFRCMFVNEGAADYGGPFRDFMEQVFKDISEVYFEKTSSIHQESEKRQQIPYTSLKDTYKDIERYKYIGIMIGYALRNVYCIPLDFSSIFWKRVLKLAVTFEDLEHSDSTRYNQLQSILNGQDQTVFAADFGDGVEVELCQGGAAIAVTPENCQKYVQLYIQKYLSLNQMLYDNLILGIQQICPQGIIAALNLNNIGRIACSAPTINLDELRKSVKVSCDDHLEYFEGLFWAMIEQMSNAERSLLLRFITGSSRVDPSETVCIDFQEIIYSRNKVFDWDQIEEYKANPQINPQNMQYPIAHTCGFSVDVPLYTSLEMMTEKIITAINICGQIDNDFEMGHEDRYWQEDSYYANLDGEQSDAEISFTSQHGQYNSEQDDSESDSQHRSGNSDE